MAQVALDEHYSVDGFTLLKDGEPVGTFPADDCPTVATQEHEDASPIQVWVTGNDAPFTIEVSGRRFWELYAAAHQSA